MLRADHRAPGILGALFFALLALVAGCDRAETPEWSGETVEEELAAGEPQPVAATTAPATSDPGEQVRFIAYNLENWLTMDRYVDGERVSSHPKPDGEKDAAVTMLARHRPDILGLCEIGDREDLEDLRQRLAEAGIEMPHAHHTGGADPTRRLALLSRFPIAATEDHGAPEIEIPATTGGTLERGMSRGILDATVDSPVGPLRFLGVHLKSKREIPEADQEQIRRAEAHQLRAQANRILDADPATPLIVYGDLNDSRQASAIRTVRGPSDGPRSLKMIRLKDSRGDYWTHHWTWQDIYSRFDYILTSVPVLDWIVEEETYVIDDPEWADASDHRALVLTLDRS